MELFLNRAFKAAVLLALFYIGFNIAGSALNANEMKTQLNQQSLQLEKMSMQIDTLKVQMEQLKETHPYMKK